VRPRVLFVEDEPSIYEPFSKALAREGFEPVVARTAARALELADGDFAIVLLDLTLPDGDGRDICRALRRSSSVPILMLTARGTEADRIVGLELGADDYVVKPFDPDELLARIQRLILRAGDTRALSPDSAGSRATDFELTPRESEVLKLLVEGSNQADIAHSLSISPNTVASHIQRILLKLGVRNRAQAIALATRGQPDQSDRVSDEKRLANVGDAEGSSSTA
jgi:DNA-binding response OmpR family regulator